MSPPAASISSHAWPCGCFHHNLLVGTSTSLSPHYSSKLTSFTKLISSPLGHLPPASVSSCIALVGARCTCSSSGTCCRGPSQQDINKHTHGTCLNDTPVKPVWAGQVLHQPAEGGQKAAYVFARILIFQDQTLYSNITFLSIPLGIWGLSYLHKGCKLVT